jgi:haloacetate dehalogenase
MIDVMGKLGHDRFAVVGHDRGALVALRAALDHPEHVSHLAVIDVIPTVEMWDSLTGIGVCSPSTCTFLLNPTTCPSA